MPNKPDVSIIIPAYNEEEGITSVITQLRHPYNKGYGVALKTDIRNAEADIVLFMDI